MRTKVEQNAGAKLKTPGLIPGMIAGLMLGLLTQIHYLSFIAWEFPYWRMIGGSLGGILLGLVLTVSLGKGFYRLKLLSNDQPYLFPGYALLITALLAWQYWDTLAGRGLLWGTLPFWLLTTFSLGRICSLLAQYSSEQKQKLLITSCLIVVLLFGLYLRFSGLSHGLPDYIVHNDTPKQLRLIPQFIGGDPEPPDSYPVGHIYFYSNILRLWRAITGINSPVPELTTFQTLKDLTPYIISIRAFQAILGSFIPFFAFLIGRNLWGPWAGLIASFLVACDPIHLTYSRQEMGEVPQTFWVMTSLWLSTRFLKSKKGIDIFLAGLCAGLAVAVKIYGGYIVLTAVTAVLFSPFRKFRGIGLILCGMFCGITFGSYLWFNPTTWFNNVVGESFSQLFIHSTLLSKSRSDLIQEGLIYFWRGMAYRFHLPWMILSLMGIGFLFLRHQKEERFFLIPTICALLIIVSRLSYLREWDFVNLSPLLAIAIACLIISLLKHLWGFPFYRNIALLLLSSFMTFQAFVALGDAWIAKQPDTRQLARVWCLQHLTVGSLLLYDTNLSGGYASWPPREGGITLKGTPIQDLLKNKTISDIPNEHLAVLERAWWELPNLTHHQPMYLFDLRNTYWENPEIFAFHLNPSRSYPNLILPHTMVRFPDPAFLNTSWSECQPLDLLSKSEEIGEQLIFAHRPINDIGYALLGHGQGSIFFGPVIGFPTEVKMGKITSGFFAPHRRILPWFPRTYKITLVPKPGKQVLWLGIYPKPEQMASLLFRYEAWSDLEGVARIGLSRKDAPSELSLFYVTALAAQGKNETANQELARLHQRQPDFLSLYHRLAASKDENFDITLGKMANATKADSWLRAFFGPNDSEILGS